VGPLVAAELGAAWCDLDRKIEAAAGCSVAQIFARDGEAAFRALEREAMTAALAEPAQVIATGGGWAAQPGNLAAAELVSLTIYMSVSPEMASRRLGPAADRPLLAGDPLPTLEVLLAQRASWYALAGVEIDATGRPETVAEGIVTAARLYGGWLR
jgi:shikimate kinase